MEVLRNGRFMFQIAADELSRGIRPSKRVPLNERYLVESIGAVGLDGVLQVIDDLESNRIDTSVIIDPFPYPQIFILSALTLVCGKSQVYELEAGVLVLKITVDPGTLWSVVDFYNYIYMSNGVEAVIRSATDGDYTNITNLPKAEAMCNFNGQVLIGAYST